MRRHAARLPLRRRLRNWAAPTLGEQAAQQVSPKAVGGRVTACGLVAGERLTMLDGALEGEVRRTAWRAGFVEVSRLVGQLVAAQALA
jgi:hypothetical protein